MLKLIAWKGDYEPPNWYANVLKNKVLTTYASIIWLKKNSCN